MRSWFHSERIWAGSAPFPHILILLEQYPQARAFAAAHQGVLDRYRERLGIVPLEWLHSTVQGFHQPATQAQVEELAAAAREVLADAVPFTVQLGPSYVGRSAVHVSMYPEDGMADLNRRIRAAGDKAGIPMRPAGSRFWPHAILAYGTSPHWDSDQLARDLVDLRPDRVEFTVDRVHLVHERQDPEAGYYTWDILEELPFG